MRQEGRNKRYKKDEINATKKTITNNKIDIFLIKKYRNRSGKRQKEKRLEGEEAEAEQEQLEVTEELVYVKTSLASTT